MHWGRRGVWIEVVKGAVEVASVRLATGNSIGITQMQAIALTAHEPNESLLFDFGMSLRASGER